MSPTWIVAVSLTLFSEGPALAQDPPTASENGANPSSKKHAVAHEQAHPPDFVVPEDEMQVFNFGRKMDAEREGFTAAALNTVNPTAALPPSGGAKPPTYEELQAQRAAKFNATFGQGSFEKIEGFSNKCENPDCNKFATVKILMGAHGFVDLKTEVETGKIREQSPQYGQRLGAIKNGMREGIRTMTPQPGVKKEYETELNDISQPIIKVVFTPEEREHMATNIARRNDSAPSYANLGSTLRDTGKPDQALEAYNTALEKDSRNETALVGRSQISFAKGDYSAAARDASAALKINPENKVAHTTLMLSQGRGGYQDGGAVAGGAAGEGAPGSSPAGTGGGAAGPGAGAYSGAASGPPATPAMTAKADGLTLEAKRQLSVGDPKGAVASLKKAVELNPRNAQAFSLASIAHNRLKDYPAALAAAEAGLKLAPNSSVLLNSKSFALARMKQYKGALEAADYALMINPKDPMAHFNRAAALRGLGDRAGMIDSLKNATLFDPQFQPVLDAALKMPEDSDVFLLLPGEAKELPEGAAGSGSRSPWRSWGLAAAGGAVLLFGILIARGSKAPPAAPARSKAMPATLAGKYQVGPELGSGGMGVVYEGKDTSLDRPVAIKRMREEIRWDQKERERFVAEARLVAKLHHPNIVEIHEIVEQDGEVYLVFELVSGLTLYETIGREKRLGFAKARDLMRGIASALDYAHGRKVIHRDLKPGNVMIDGDGRVRVMDFGIARLAKEAMTRHSTTGAVVGTPPYMAPEQEQGVTRQESDVFAMASCLYEAVTGRLPFNGEGAGLLMNKLNKAFLPPSNIVPELPAGLDGVMARALDPNPELRYPSAGAFLKDLENLS